MRIIMISSDQITKLELRICTLSMSDFTDKTKLNLNKPGNLPSEVSLEYLSGRPPLTEPYSDPLAQMGAFYIQEENVTLPLPFPSTASKETPRVATLQTMSVMEPPNRNREGVIDGERYMVPSRRSPSINYSFNTMDISQASIPPPPSEELPLPKRVPLSLSDLSLQSYTKEPLRFLRTTAFCPVVMIVGILVLIALILTLLFMSVLGTQQFLFSEAGADMHDLLLPEELKNLTPIFEHVEMKYDFPFYTHIQTAEGVRRLVIIPRSRRLKVPLDAWARRRKRRVFARKRKSRAIKPPKPLPNKGKPILDLNHTERSSQEQQNAFVNAHRNSRERMLKALKLD